MQWIQRRFQRAVIAVVIVAGCCTHAEAADDFTAEFDGVCGELVRLANTKPYVSLIERTNFQEDDSLRSVFRPAFRNATALASSASYHRVDLDDDGHPDHVALALSGTMNITEAFVLLSEKETSVGFHLGGIDQAQGMDVGLDVGLIHINEQWLHITPRGSYLTLWAVRNDALVKACMLSQYPDQVRTLKSIDDALCEKAKNKQLDYVDYSASHALKSFPDEARFWMRRPGRGMREIDIDNDGRLDHVARIEFSSGAGRGCNAKYIAVLDETNSTVPANSVNAELERIEGHCGPDMELFIENGQTYLQSSYEDSHVVGKFTQGRYEKICEFVKGGRYERLR